MTEHGVKPQELRLPRDAATSVIDGMPREAVRRGAASVVAPLDTIAERLLTEIRRRRQT